MNKNDLQYREHLLPLPPYLQLQHASPNIPGRIIQRSKGPVVLEELSVQCKHISGAKSPREYAKVASKYVGCTHIWKRGKPRPSRKDTSRLRGRLRISYARLFGSSGIHSISQVASWMPHISVC
jgi:hypothetical protein